MLQALIVAILTSVTLLNYSLAAEKVEVSPVVQIGHHGLVKDLAFSPDERLLASASWDGSVRIWDWEKGRLLRTHSLLGRQAETVAFDPSGKLVASGDEAGVQIWRVETGDVIAELDLKGVRQLAFKPRGDALVIATEHGCFLWRPAEGNAPQRLSMDEARSIAVSSDGHWAATGNGNGTLTVHDLAGQRKPELFVVDEAWVWSVAFLPGSKEVATGSINGVRVWDVISHEQKGHVGERSYVWHLSINSRFEALLTVSGEPCIWDLKSQTKGKCFGVKVADFGAGVFSSSGKFAAFSSPIPLVYDTSSTELRSHSDSTYLSDIAVFSPDGQALYTSDDSGRRLIDLKKGTTVWAARDRSFDMRDFAFSADSHLFVQGFTRDNSIAIVNTADGHEMARLKPPGVELTKLAFIGSTHRIVAASARGELLILDANRGTELVRRRFGVEGIGVVSSDITGASLLIGDNTGRWCILSGEQLIEKKCLQRKGTAEQGAVYPDGHRALMVEADGFYNTIEYDFRSGEYLRDFGHTVPAVAIDNAGTLAFRAGQLVSASASDTESAMVVDHVRSLQQVAISDDKHNLLVLDLDGELFLEHIRQGKIRLQRPWLDRVSAFSLCSSDGAEIAYVNKDGEVHYRSSGEDFSIIHDALEPSSRHHFLLTGWKVRRSRR